MDFYSHFEDIIGEKFPPCVVKLLKECGYSTSSTLHEFTSKNIDEMEEFIEENSKEVLSNLNCCNASTYKNQKVFKFLPAHRKFIISLSAKHLEMKRISSQSQQTQSKSFLSFCKF